MLDNFAFLSAILHPMVVHGTSKNLCIYNGKNGVVKVIAVINVWLIERLNGKLSVKPQSSTMVNGPSSVYLGFRLVFFFNRFFLFWLFPYNMSFDLPCSLPGACFCCFLCTQPSNAFPWLAFLFHHDLL